MRSKSMVLGSLLGDAICLGPHWVYDPEEIVRRIGRPDRYHDPVSDYHPGKRAGDFTHYGDQTVLLCRHLDEAGDFDLDRYAAVWRAFWEDPATISYRDQATRVTLENLRKGMPPQEAGSSSKDLAGASRTGALFLLEWRDDDALFEACRELAAFTHRDPAVGDAAVFFAKMVRAVQNGDGIVEAMEREGGKLSNRHLVEWLAAAAASADSAKPDGEVLARHGLSCNIEGGFSGVCHLLLRHPADPLTALMENAKAGGDNAARGMMLGMVYGAAGLIDRLPVEWARELRMGEFDSALPFGGFGDRDGGD